MKANFKTETKINVDHEVELPYYCKSNLSYYKIIDDKVAIKVEYWDARNYSISMISADIAFSCSDKPCDKEDFDMAFQQISLFINAKANE